MQLIETGEQAKVYWQCELPNTESSRLILLQAIDRTRFIAVINKGLVFIGDSEQRKIDLIAQLDCISDSGCWVNSEQNQLWFVADFRNPLLKGRHVVNLDLISGELQHWPIEGTEHDFTTLFLRQDGKLAFYGRNDKPGYKFRQHGIHTFDPKSGEQQYTSVDSKPTPDSIPIRPCLFQDKKRGLVLLPHSDGIDLVDTNTFAYKLQMLDLNQGSILWTKTVRNLHIESIADSYDQQELSDALIRIANGQYAFTDADHWQTFLSCLTGVWFDQQNEEVWLGWQDCTLQKIDIHGERLTPVYKVGEVADDGSYKTLYGFDLDRLSPMGLKQDKMLIAYGFDLENQLQVAVPQNDNFAIVYSDEPKWLAAEQVEVNQLDIPTSVQVKPSTTGCIHIITTNLDTECGKVKALENLLQIMPDLERVFNTRVKPSLLNRIRRKNNSSRENKTLYFGFSDALGNTKSEKQFFYDAAIYESCRKLITEIIQAFNKWPHVNELLGYNTEPPLANAVCSISVYKEYLDILAEHFCAIGGGEDIHGFHINHTLSCIREQHKNTAEIDTFYANVPWPYNDENFVKPLHDEYDDW